MDSLLSLKNIRKSYGDRPIFENLACDFYGASANMILGENGSGKTTLLKLMAGLARPSTGEILFRGDPRIGYLGHNTFLYSGLSALENLKFWARLHKLPVNETNLMTALKKTGLASRADDHAGSFSRGMAQRLSFARLSIEDPDVWLLDEPFSGLDAGSRSLMRNELREAADRGRLVIFVSHNPEEDGEIADMTLVIENRGIRRSSDWRGAGEERRG